MPCRRNASLVVSMISFLIIAPLIIGLQTNAQSRRCSLTIVNNSRKQVHRLYISTSGAPRWGADVLGSNVLHPGQSTMLGDLNPGPYDLMIIDSEKRQCVLRSFPVSGNNSWPITNEWLAQCPQ